MFNKKAYFLNRLMVVCSLLMMVGCTYRPAVEQPITNDQLPSTWKATNQQNELENKAVHAGWLKQYADSEASDLISQALENNFALLANLQQVNQSKTRTVVAEADRWPQVGVSLDANRSQSQINNFDVITETFSVGASVSWEADLWGRLSAQDQAAVATWLATEFDYRSFRLSVTANVLKAWYNVTESRQLLALFERRLANLKVNQDVIELGFRQGINGALDVYLARSDVNREVARVKEQQQLLSDRIRELQLLVGAFPTGKVQGGDEYPVLSASVPAGVPSELLQRRYDIQAAFYRLQSADANLAAAHRNRFPSLSLTASGGKSSDSFSDLLDGATQWSVGASLLQTLFDQGRLKALEEEARYRLLEQEQRYKNVVFEAFKEVESFLSNETALLDQLKAYSLAQENAVAAERQAFEQYRKGLVAYATVLEAQRRAFDTQTSVIQLKNRLLQNRINLHVALGGDFE